MVVSVIINGLTVFFRSGPSPSSKKNGVSVPSNARPPGILRTGTGKNGAFGDTSETTAFCDGSALLGLQQDFGRVSFVISTVTF